MLPDWIVTPAVRSAALAAPLALVALALASPVPRAAAGPADLEPASESAPAALYARDCAGCHDAPADARTPGREALQRLTPMGILSALEFGVMRSQAAALSARERRAVALFLSTRPPGPEPLLRGRCPAAAGAVDLDLGPRWSGFGGSPGGARHQTDALTAAKLAPDTAGRLALRWAFGFPGASVANGALVAAGGRLFVGSEDGTVYSLDAATGCVHWSFRADAWVRTALAIETRAGGEPRHVAYFGDSLAFVYAVDAVGGGLLWKRSVDEDGIITGSPQVHEGRVFVPVSVGIEVPRAADPQYECCRLRGSVVALAAGSGAILWKTHTTEEPRPTQRNARGTQMYGPSGAPIWSSITVDPRRGALYVGTGENYSPPATGTSDAVLALSLASGEILWARQFTEGDVWQASCSREGGLAGNCPFTPGPDVDVGATPVLQTLSGGKQLLLVGEKSGRVHALDPDQRGAVLWSERVGRGGMQGGVHWGIAADEATVYAPVSDQVVIVSREPGRITSRSDPQAGALVALDAATGQLRWKIRAAPDTCLGREGCFAALSAAPALVSGGVVFAGALDGHLRAYSARDGRVLWDFDTVREFETVNGVPARGGAIDGAGPIAVGGMVYVNSGYGRFGQLPGNALLAFAVE